MPPYKGGGLLLLLLLSLFVQVVLKTNVLLLRESIVPYSPVVANVKILGVVPYERAVNATLYGWWLTYLFIFFSQKVQNSLGGETHTHRSRHGMLVFGRELSFGTT